MLDGTSMCSQYRSCGILPDGSYAGPGSLTFTIMLDGTSMCSQYRSCGILPDGSYAGPGPLTFTSNVGWDKHMQPIQELWDPA
ncbi:hypothetical protein J6590_018587 [Homalodisca vitripennis]|nr:hypothetical protein J6590_018587 [Homalodisca vitripennis]